MTLKERIDLVRRLHSLILRKATGTPNELARKLGISPPSLFRYIETLREFGAPVAFCRVHQRYYYTEEFELDFNVKF